MKEILIAFAKLIIILLEKFDRGTSLPGAIALKLKPDILNDFVLPQKLIAVTGSNGKTSTTEMISAVLERSGKKVFFNKEGSNQIEGITTLFMKHCDLSGRLNFDVAVIECDERYTPLIFRYVKPTHLLVLNLYRDQLTRNGHPYFVRNYIKDAINLIPDSTLILNADDPIVTSLGHLRKNVLYYGLEKNGYCTDNTNAKYNDCAYCPFCKAPMNYEYFHYAHLGKYCCTSCSYTRPETHFTVSLNSFEDREIYINENVISLPFASRYNIYNLCAAFAASYTLDSDSKASETLSDFVAKSGRIVTFTAGANKGILLISKHENSISYNQNIEYITSLTDAATVVFLVDEISRKYYTSETGWLWDISFENMEKTNVKTIVLAGKYCFDLALRLQFAGISTAEIITVPDIDEMIKIISAPTENKLFCITCFSDKDKIFSRVNVNSPTAK